MATKYCEELEKGNLKEHIYIDLHHDLMTVFLCMSLEDYSISYRYSHT